MWMRLHRDPLVLAAMTLLVAQARAQQEKPADWRFSIEPSYLYGNIQGYVQTPSGGEPGTTSGRRPKLDEIGISSASVYDFGARGTWRDEKDEAGGGPAGLREDAVIARRV